MVLLGATGSIGTSALAVVDAHPDRLRVVALAAGRNAAMLDAQAREFGVPADRARLAADDPTVLAELAALSDADVVLNAVVGAAMNGAGVSPTRFAISPRVADNG